MPPSRHTAEGLLDATRSVILRVGPRATTISAIAKEAGATVGSIYHRFTSLDDMLAGVWLRAVEGTQSAYAISGPVSAVSMALAHFDHCVEHPKDVLVLEVLRRPDVEALNLSEDVRRRVEEINAGTARGMGRLVEQILGRSDPVTVDLFRLAVIDLPYAFAQDALHRGETPPPARREHLPAAVEAVLGVAPPT